MYRISKGKSQWLYLPVMLRDLSMEISILEYAGDTGLAKLAEMPQQLKSSYSHTQALSTHSNKLAADTQVCFSR